MSIVLRVTALLFFALGLLVAAGLIVIDAADWQPSWVFLFAGLGCWCASTLMP